MGSLRDLRDRLAGRFVARAGPDRARRRAADQPDPEVSAAIGTGLYTTIDALIPQREWTLRAPLESF